MSHHKISLLSTLLLSAALVLGAAPVQGATPEPPGSVTVATAVWVPPAPPASYDPPTGVKFNRPLGTLEDQRIIRRHINLTIDSTPAGSRIEIISWNIRDPEFVDRLIAAHKRMVTVRVLIAHANWMPDNPNELMDRMLAAFRRTGEPWSNDKRPVSERSRARYCLSSCRGVYGMAHSKLYLFSHVGKSVEKPTATGVVMHGSANATLVATSQQWNDMHTLKDRPALYGFLSDIFKEAEKDEPVRPPYARKEIEKFIAEVFPWGARDGDPVLRELNRTVCKGATDGTGVDGRTHIRIAQTATLDDRGQAIARRLKTMWDRGCNIRIVYAVMGNGVLDILRAPDGRGPVPIRQIAQDWQGDGVYDRYLHMKVMTISGVWNGDTSAEVAFNGSSNWTTRSLRSDETFGTVLRPVIRERYADYIDWLFFNPPSRTTVLPRIIPAPLEEIPGPDRYHGIEP